MDFTFDEQVSFMKSRESHMDEDKEEKEAPRNAMMFDSTLKEHIPKGHIEIVESKILVVPPI
jgi:hypothetical protein